MEFPLATLPLGAGTLALCPLPADAPARTRLRRFAPSLVISLTETDEMRSLGAADLPAWLADHGIGWTHFPVPDYQTPPDDADWPALSTRTRAILWSGGAVAVHCRGGCGRSGMIALRLMVDSGEAPEPALARLRQARPCAIETPAQAAWASAPIFLSEIRTGGSQGGS